MSRRTRWPVPPQSSATLPRPIYSVADAPAIAGGVACRLIYQRVDGGYVASRVLGGVAAMAIPFMGARARDHYLPAPPPDRPLLLTNLRLFDGTRQGGASRRALLIKGSLITDLPAAGIRCAVRKSIDCQDGSSCPG